MGVLSVSIMGVGLLLSSCSNNSSITADASPLAGSDFEQFDGWMNDSPALAALTKEQAHSGKFSTVSGPGNEFSLGYNNQLQNLSPEWPAKLTISAWLFVPDEKTTAKLVIEVKNSTANKPNLLWEDVNLADKVRLLGKWQHVEHIITMPDDARPDSRLLVYVWSANAQHPVYMDDLQIFSNGK